MMHAVGSRKIEVDRIALSKLPITLFYWCTAQSQKRTENVHVSKLNHNSGVSSGYDKGIGFVYQFNSVFNSLEELFTSKQSQTCNRVDFVPFYFSLSLMSSNNLCWASDGSTL